MDFGLLQPEGADDMLLIAGWIAPDAATWLGKRSKVHALLAGRP